MKSKFKILSNCLVVLSLLTISRSAIALPIGVSYSVSGSSGNYDLDFTVQNNMPVISGQLFYFFGVQLSARNITGSPAGWDPNAWISWNNFANLGVGSSITYNNVWIGGSLPPGSSQSGFKVHITDATAPSSVNWFAFTVDGFSYTGGDNFYGGNPAFNPGFESITSTGSVPDASSTLPLLSLAVITLGGMGQRFRKS